jgi:hypothetical protein
MEARSFGVDGYFPNSGDVGEKIVCTLLCIDIQKGL